MKLIINTTNLYVGGGVQVALSFLNELNNKDSSNDYHVFLSKAVKDQLELNFFSANFKFYSFSHSPARLLKRREITKIMTNLEAKILPDIVFTVFGPAYWRPKSKHIMGFALPWVLNKNSPAYSKLSLLLRIKMWLKNNYLEFYSKRDADFYVIETDDAKNKLVSVLDIPSDLVYVVGNSYSSVFDNIKLIETTSPHYIKLPDKELGEFRLLLISHPYAHKNLELINSIVPLIQGKKIRFVLTIDDAIYDELFIKSEKIINLGPISQLACPSVYSQCDALFHPSLLEVFSASYPEAMKMKLPILASDMMFARDVCDNSALYFDPSDPVDALNKIDKLMGSSKLQNDMVSLGEQRVAKFESAKSRSEKYLHICSIVKELEG